MTMGTQKVRGVNGGPQQQLIKETNRAEQRVAPKNVLDLESQVGPNSKGSVGHPAGAGRILPIRVLAGCWSGLVEETRRIQW